MIDDIVDIELQVLEGELIGRPNDLGDSVFSNDVEFTDDFPFVGIPHNDAVNLIDGDNRVSPARQPVLLEEALDDDGLLLQPLRPDTGLLQRRADADRQAAVNGGRDEHRLHHQTHPGVAEQAGEQPVQDVGPAQGGQQPCLRGCRVGQARYAVHDRSGDGGDLAPSATTPTNSLSATLLPAAPKQRSPRSRPL